MSRRQPSARKLKRAPAASIAFLKKENRRRFKNLVQTTRENGLAAKRLASLLNLTTAGIPNDLIRQMRAAAERVMKVAPSKSKSLGKR